MAPESKTPESRASRERNEEPWQGQLASPEERLAELLQSSRLTDLTVTFPGHKKVMKVLSVSYCLLCILMKPL